MFNSLDVKPPSLGKVWCISGSKKVAVIKEIQLTTSIIVENEWRHDDLSAVRNGITVMCGNISLQRFSMNINVKKRKIVF